LGNQTIELKPLTTEEFLELIYMSSDVLHDALVAWVGAGEETSSFLMALLSKLDRQDAIKCICMFLHLEPNWLEENVSATETFGALSKAVRLNDWSGILQVLVILDTLKMDEVMQLWQMVKAGSSLKKS
jgi:hypothetical protein